MKKILVLGLSVLLLSSCAELLNIFKMANIKKPTASVTNTKITGLSFKQADLLIDIKIDNPNTVGIDLAGMDFDLKINNKSLLSGNKNEPMQIVANGSNTIQVPLSLKYDDIYKIVTSLAGDGQSTYQFSGGLNFDLPVLGIVHIPISKSGELPLLKIPDVKIKKLILKSFSFSAAYFDLEISVSGAGGVPLFIDNLSYNFNVGGKMWIGGETHRRIDLNNQKENVITVPFKLDFLSMGKAAYDIVAGSADFDYSLDGSMNISSDNPLLKAAEVNFNDLSKIVISK